MKRWRHVALVLGMLAVCAVPACARAARPPESKAPAAPPPTLAPAQAERLRTLGYVADAAGGAAPQAASAPGRPAGRAPLAAMAAARKLIRSAQLTVEVPRYAEAARAVARIAEEHGGYVADSRASRNEQDKQRGTISIRVPAERFAPAFEALKALGRVRTESVGTQDVTKAYVELETRLRVKRETEARLREILRTRAAKLSEVLEAERELARLIEEIEQMEGERRYYDQQVALSTITLELYEPQAMVEAGWFDPARQALRGSLQVLSTSVAAIICALAFLAPWLLVLWVVWRIVRAVRGRRRAAASKAE